MPNRVYRPNPYRPGTGRRPPLLAGRDAAIEEFEQALAEPESRVMSFMLVGARGVGKSTLAEDWAQRAKAGGYATIRYEVSPSFEDPRHFEEEMLANIAEFRRQLSILEHAKQIATAAAPDSTSVTWASPVGDLTMEVKPRGRRKGPFSRQLTEEFRELGELAKSHHRGVLLILDEFQTARDNPKGGRNSINDLLTAVTAAQERGLPVMLVLAGLPSTQLHVREGKSNVERSMSIMELKALSQDDALRALTVPARTAGISWELAVAQRAIDEAGRYPYLLQLYGQAAWDAAVRLGRWTIDYEVFGMARVRVMNKLERDVFEPRYLEASAADREFMKGAAMVGREVFKTKDLVSLWPDRSESSIRLALGRLAADGLSSQVEYGTWSWAIPNFGTFLRAVHPYQLATVREKFPAVAITIPRQLPMNPTLLQVPLGPQPQLV